MRSSKFVWILAAAVLGGCTRPSKEVTVDVAMIVRGEVVPIIEAPMVTPALPPIGEMRGTVFGLHEPPSQPGTMAREAQNAKDFLEHNRLLTLRSVRERLYRAYRKSVESWRLAEIERLKQVDQVAVIGAYEAIGARLREIAPERGQTLQKLTFITMFPLRPPSFWPAAPSDSPWRLRRREEALRLYDVLKAVDERFAADARAILDDATAKGQARQNAFQLEYADRLDAALQQASLEADSIMMASAKDFESDLANFAIKPQLAAAEAHVVIPASPKTPVPAPPQSALAGEEAAMAESAVRHDLQIWLSLKGYRLAELGGFARDATKEFYDWRRSRHPGP